MPMSGTYVRVCVCVCVCIYIYIYIYRERERERENYFFEIIDFNFNIILSLIKPRYLCIYMYIHSKKVLQNNSFFGLIPYKF
jgi:NADPH-dependent 7-cyano-7-deazaguanine reductase QueF